MAQIMIIAGSTLVAGSGVFQLLRGKPMKKKDGTELSMSATRGISITCLIVGGLGLVYGFMMG